MLSIRKYKLMDKEEQKGEYKNKYVTISMNPDNYY
jgi:hypothetical protein